MDHSFKSSLHCVGHPRGIHHTTDLQFSSFAQIEANISVSVGRVGGLLSTRGFILFSIFQFLTAQLFPKGYAHREELVLTLIFNSIRKPEARRVGSVDKSTKMGRFEFRKSR